MFILSTGLRILIAVIVAIATILVGIIGQAIWPNIIYWIKRGGKPKPRGRPPSPMSFRIWATFMISAAITVLCGSILTIIPSSQTLLPTQIAWVYVTPVGLSSISPTGIPSNENQEKKPNASCFDTNDYVSDIVWNKDGKTLIIPAAGSIRFWRVSDGILLHSTKAQAGLITSIGISPDGLSIVSAEFLLEGDHVVVFDEASGQIKYDFEMTVLGDPPSTHIKDVAFSPDGKTFSGVTNSGGVRVWNYSDGSLLYTLKYPSFGSISSYPSVEGFVFAVAYSPDSKTLATGGLDHLIRFWRLSDGQALTTSDHQVGIEALAFSPNGELLASAGHEGPIRIWRTSDGSLLETLEGHLDTVYQLSWSPDGKMLASGGADKTVRLWDIKTGQQILFLKGHAKTVTSVAFSPDGKTLASGSSDHTVCLWQLKP